MAAPYRVEFAGSARRALSRLPDKVAAAVVEFIYGQLADNPERVGRPLRFELEGLHSAHRGDYRIIYRIRKKERIVSILTIGHRSDVYRQR